MILAATLGFLLANSSSTGDAAPASARQTIRAPHLLAATANSAPTNVQAPKITTFYQGESLLPVLVGAKYLADSGIWRSTSSTSYSVQWLRRHKNGALKNLTGAIAIVSHERPLTVPSSADGQNVIAHVCASNLSGQACVDSSLSQSVQTVAQYNSAGCGYRRPAAPAYDNNFSSILWPRALGWYPCQTITWALDTFHQPALSGSTWPAATLAALAQIHQATGLVFHQAPNFSVRPHGQNIRAPRGVQVVIGFTPQNNEVGVGGVTDSSQAFATAGIVLLNSQTKSTFPWDQTHALETLLHELGHVVGLGHPVAEPPAFDPENEIMDPVLTTFTRYQPGDLCGLYEFTWRQPCRGANKVTLGKGRVGQGAH